MNQDPFADWGRLRPLAVRIFGPRPLAGAPEWERLRWMRAVVGTLTLPGWLGVIIGVAYLDETWAWVTFAVVGGLWLLCLFSISIRIKYRHPPWRWPWARGR